jgi:hypothetical protein
VFNAVKDSPDQENMTNLRLIDTYEVLDETFVPYTGAKDDVDLGAQGITTEWVKLNTTPVIPTDQGSVYWDEDDNVLAVVLNGAIQKVGEVTFYNVKNQTGSTIPKGTGVGFAGVVGASARIKVAPFLADGSQPSIYYVGITAEEILDGEDGKVYNFGPIRGLNTSAFSEGDVLYASSTVAGGFTTTPPTAPNNVIVVAAVLTDSATVGALLVRVTVADLGGGSAGAGAGLSIDGGGDIQLGKTDPFDPRLQYVDLQEFDTEPLFILATDFDSYYISRDSPYSAIEVFSNTNEAYNFTRISSDNDAASVDMYASNSPRTAYAKIKVDTFTSESSIELSRDHLLVTDSINSKGLENLDDYESNFTARSLVTKQYVDGLVSGGGRDDDAVHYDAADAKTLSERQQAADNTRGMALNTTTVTTSGQINNVSTPTDTLIFTAATDLTGFVPNTTGFLRIVNKNTVNVLIRNNSTLSSAANRIVGLVANISIKPSNFFDLMYDFDQSRWIPMGYPIIKSNGATGGTSANTLKGGSSIQSVPIFEVQNSGNTLVFAIRGDGLIVTSGMPTADPGISGALWNDGGTVKIS